MSRFKRLFTDWKILKRVLITLGLIFVFRLGTLITIPGATLAEDATNFDTGSFLGIMNMLGGGGLVLFSIFALGVTPYITATIIIQLLSSDVVPPLARLNKSGEKGRKKIEKITRLTAIAIAILEGLAISISLVNSGYVTINGLMGDNEWVNYIMFTLIMIMGSMICLWIADLITMYGIGNGTSILIFVGIVGNIPTKIMQTYNWIVPATIGAQMFLGIFNFIFYMFAAMSIIFVVGFFETSERRIPIQQTGRGLQLIESQDTYLPIKTNPAGVIPVIFASAIMTLPPIIAQFFPDNSFGKTWIEENFALSAPIGMSLYATLIVLFTFFYGHINIKAAETAENFQKSNTFIVGIKPGKDTEKYISRSVTSMLVVGAIVLTTIAILPYLLEMFGVPQTVAIGGTSSIIAISVAIDLYDQLNARLLASDKVVKEARKINTNIKGDMRSAEEIAEDEIVLFK